MAYLPLLHKLSKRLQGWASKQLSIAGRLILINAVLSSIPTYFMSIFKLPEWVIQEIDKIRRNFLWKNVNEDKRGMALANWDLICRPKKFGGLGIIDIHKFNDALLAKWYWYWQKPESRLWKSIIQATHIFSRASDLPDCRFFTQNLGNIIIFCESSMERILQSGERTKFWHQNWGHGILKNELPLLFEGAIDKGISVQQMFQMSCQGQTTTAFLDIETIAAMNQGRSQLLRLNGILGNQPPLVAGLDSVIWNREASKAFTVKSAYLGLKDQPRFNVGVHRVWRLKVPPRMKVFAWLIFYDKILTADNLAKRGWNLPSMCFLCRRANENVKHMFSECRFTLKVYEYLSICFDLPDRRWSTLFKERQAPHWITEKGGHLKSKAVILIAMFVCWRERCSRIFREEYKDIHHLTQEVIDQWLWLQE